MNVEKDPWKRDKDSEPERDKSPNGFGSILIFIFVVLIFTSLRTESGRCTVLPFIFTESCNNESIADNKKNKSDYVEKYEYYDSEDSYYLDKKGREFIMDSIEIIDGHLDKFTSLSKECIDFYPIQYRERNNHKDIKIDLRERHNNFCGGDPSIAPRIKTIHILKMENGEITFILDHWLCGNMFIEDYKKDIFDPSMCPSKN